MDTLSAALLLFLIMDPLGNVPLFLSLLRELPAHRRRVVLLRELLIALAVLFVFLFFGKYILQVLQLKQSAVSIAGGAILFLIGLKMIFPPAEGVFGEGPAGEPFIVPMAIPLIAGPSTMAVLLLLGGQNPERSVDWSIALLLAWVGTAAILLFATVLHRYLGTRVLTAMERLMGMLLVALSIQMLLDGTAAYIMAVRAGT